MSVSEKGCRLIYSTTSKEIKSNGRVVSAAVYRESYSGRIAAMYHNNDRLFRATKFTLVPRDNFRGEIDARKIYELQVVYDGQERDLDRSLRPFSLVSDNVGRMQVDRILQRVIQLTFLQSEDPSWHLLRAFMFTSRTSHNFLRAVCRNYENNLAGLARILKGKRIAKGVVHLPRDEENVKEALHKRWDTVLDCLKMRKDSVDEEIDLIGPSSIISLSDSAINALTKSEIGKFLTAAGRRPAAALRKPELLERLKNLRDAVSSGEITLPEPQVLSENETIDKHASDVVSSLMQASLESWLMKLLVATTGMKEGTMNEIEVLHNLPNFFRCEQQPETGDNSTCTDMNMFVNDTDTTRFKIDFIRSVGLLSNRQNPMLGDSPDGLCAITDSDGGTFSAALEVKTMTSANTIERAKTKKHEHGGFVVVDDIGLSRSSNTLFQEIVDTSQYRLQCLHHAAVCQVSTVLFVVAEGGTAARGGIIFVAVLNFSETIKNAYLHCLDSVRVAAFEWVGRPSSCIPTAYDGLLSNTHATDIYSLSSYYSLGNALRQHIIREERPLPPARMICPTYLVYWNALKGGVDEYSKALKTLARTNSSENPIVSVIGRLISSQVHASGIVHRLGVARDLNKLPRKPGLAQPQHRGYSIARRRVSQCETLGQFVRRLARAWLKQYLRDITKNNDDDDRIESTPRSQFPVLKPRFKAHAAKQFNRSLFKQMRLNKQMVHKVLKSNAAYCSLCSWSYTWKYRGKNYQRKGGNRRRAWCSICPQPICESCWETWHNQPLLQRAKPTAEEIKTFQDRVRGSNGRGRTRSS